MFQRKTETALVANATRAVLVFDPSDSAPLPHRTAATPHHRDSVRHDAERVRIAERGHRRCIFGGYSYEGRLLTVLDHVQNIPPMTLIQPVDEPLVIGGLGLQPLPTH